MFDILIFALIAGFIVSRLFKVLGDTKYDKEQSEEGRRFYEEFKASSNDINTKKEIIQQIDIVSAYEASLDQKVRNVFEQIRKYKPTFSADEFVDRATTVFEKIVKAFSEHDKESLKFLLSEDVYNDFDAEIERRISSGQRHEVTIVSVNPGEIVSATSENGIASVSIKFISEQILLIKDANTKELLSGNPSKIVRVEDIWTFSKVIKSKDNIWKLVGTGGNE